MLLTGDSARILLAFRRERAAGSGVDLLIVDLLRSYVESGSGVKLSTVGEKESPNLLRSDAHGDIKSPWDSISTD